MLPKAALGSFSVALMLLAYSRYLWKASRKRVQPHPVSWFIWGLVTGVAYGVQVTRGGGAGSWVVGLTALSCFVIAALSMRSYGFHFDEFDTACLVLGLAALAAFLFTSLAWLAAVLATVADVIGYAPTVRKGWKEPDSDDAASFFLNSAKFAPSLWAMGSYSVATLLYPITVLIANAVVFVILVWRGRVLGRHAVSK
jgi:hypothetical protein